MKLTDKYLTEKSSRNLTKAKGLAKRIGDDTYELAGFLEAVEQEIEDEDNWPKSARDKLDNGLSELDDLKWKYVTHLKKIMKMVG